MSSSFVLNQNALQISQSLTAAYSGLVVAGTGLVRLTGDQNISGKKTFHGAVDFTGFPINLTGVSSFVPFSNASTDIGSASRIFKTGFFSGVTGFNGYFQNLTVANLTTLLVPSLVGVTGSNMTISGTTNIVNANISGNLGVTGTLLIRGASTLSGNTSFLGTVLSTGDKTFSGVLNQSGNVNIYGQTLVSGNSSFTGNINVTGNIFLRGNQNITGNFTHTGQHIVYSNNTAIIFTGDGGPNHALRIYAPTHLTGTLYHNDNVFHNGSTFRNGSSTSTGNITNEGDFSNTGNFNLYGNATINAGTSINFNTNPKFNSGASCSGNSIAPSLRINPNLVSSPSGGAIEYSRGQFFATNELTGSPIRALINQTYSYIAPDNFVFPFMTGSPYMFLGATGIYLSTGTYEIKYNFSLRSVKLPVLSVGLTGDGVQRFNYCHGLFTQRNNLGADGNKTNFSGNSLNPSLAFSGLGVALVANVPTKYEINAVINVTGSNMKIRPFIHSSTTTNATGLITGINFDMTVTTLSTGSGINQSAFNGPWSAS